MDNVGGLGRLYVCPVGALDRDGLVADRMALVNVPMIEDTGRRKCVRKADKNGEFWEVTVSCKVARSESEALCDLFPLAFALVTVDCNGVGRVDGSRDEPMRCEPESDTGEEFKDLSHVELKFSRKLRRASRIVSLQAISAQLQGL